MDGQPKNVILAALFRKETLLQDIDWPENRDYRSGTEFEPIEFYLSALQNSTKFDLLLGYFSFSAINVLSPGFADFIVNGGKMRVVANNVLSKRDKEAIIKAEEPQLSGIIDLEDVRGLRHTLDDYCVHFFECMAYLMAEKRIEIVLVRPKGKSGITHYKSGVFYDQETKVSFHASCNFTAYGMLENDEELSAYLKWENSRSSKKIDTQENYFESIFSGQADFLEYVPIKEAQEAITNEFGGKDLTEIEENGRQLSISKSKKLGNPRIARLISDEQDDDRPRFPFPQGPRDYQKEAYEAWVENGKSGVFAMATGTGKTITSLNCLLNEYTASGKYNAIILVPSIALLNQWEKEVESFNFKSVLKVGGGNNWENTLATYVSNVSWGVDSDLVIISTYGSFVTDRFQKYFKKVQSNFLLIGDEAHNMGAKNVREMLSGIECQSRIGLSATPKRIYDEEGTEALDKFFSDKPPYIYQFGMEKALREGYLTEYVYFPVIVELEADEMLEYLEISKKLLRFFDADSGIFSKDPMVEILLLKRKNIIHKASMKVLAFKSIVSELEKKEKLKYVFTYVPEGYVKKADGDSERMLDQFIKAGSEAAPSMKMNSYTTSDSDLKVLLRGFSEGKIDMLFAMKMLDEGVDVPRAEVGIFCSSTGNPRQFIQRRGRLLRKHKEKAFATIYDMVVAPKMSNPTGNSFKMERSLVKKELQRVGYFASLSMNYYDSRSELENLCHKYELNLDQIIEEL